MTGIERLRTLAGAWDELGLGGTLAEIADQIERERDAEVADSPYDAILPEDRKAVAWVREHGGLYDVRAEWERRSNLERTCEKLRAKVNRQQRHIEFVQGKCSERQEHIVALGKEHDEIRRRLSEAVSAQLASEAALYDLSREVRDVCKAHGIESGEDPLGALDEAMGKRLMPEGCEWPRYEDNEPVRFGDAFLDHQGNVRSVLRVDMWQEGGFTLHTGQGTEDWHGAGERVSRPAVLAADGEPLEVGQTVWDENGDELVIGAIEDGGHTVTCRYADVGDGIPVHGMWSPSDLTHQRPVLDAYGVPIKVGDTVYLLEHTAQFTVVSPHETHDNAGCELKCGHTVKIAREGHEPHMYVHPESLHHTKPEPPDSWERIEEDKGLNPFDYCKQVGHKLWTFDNAEEFKASDLVRRCRALAERERGE